MRRLRLLIAVVAVTAALGSVLLVKSIISSRPKEVVVVAPPPAPPPPEIPKVNVLIAVREIPMGQVIKPEDLRWEPWPQDHQSEFFITREKAPKAIEDMVRVMAKAGFVSGEPVVESKLIRLNGSGVMSAILRKGMMAVSIKISPDSASGGFILPGDYVDIFTNRQVELVEKSRPGRAERVRNIPRSDLLLRSVRVLAIDQSFGDMREKANVIGRNATIELLPEQVALVSIAEQRGTLVLALRAISELVDEKGNTYNRPVPEVITDIRNEYGAATDDDKDSKRSGGLITIIRQGNESNSQLMR